MRSLYVRAFQLKAVAVRDERKAFQKVFAGAFGKTSPDDIALARVWISPALRFPINTAIANIIENLMSKTLVDVFEDLRNLVQTTQANLGNDLTHEHLLQVINRAIASLS